MKIMLDDGLSISPGTGIGAMTRTLFSALKKASESDEIEMVENAFFEKIKPSLLRRGLYFLWLNTFFPQYLKNKNPSIVHFMNYLLPSAKPKGIKYIAAIHDLGVLHHPEFFIRSYVFYGKWTIHTTVKHADLIITLSQFMKEKIIELFSIPWEKVYAIPGAIHEAFFVSPKNLSIGMGSDLSEKFGIKRDFLLFVGKLEKRKNILTLLKAFNEVRKNWNLQLALVGKPGFQFQLISDFIGRNNMERDVVILQGVSLKELIFLYDSARLFIFPSFYEGFGLPLAEAMSRGLPIIASKIPTSIEVCGDAAQTYGEPSDHTSLAAKISAALNDRNLCERLAAKGLIQAKRFSPEEIARQHLEVYRRLLGYNLGLSVNLNTQ